MGTTATATATVTTIATTGAATAAAAATATKAAEGRRTVCCAAAATPALASERHRRLLVATLMLVATQTTGGLHPTGGRDPAGVLDRNLCRRAAAVRRLQMEASVHAMGGAVALASVATVLGAIASTAATEGNRRASRQSSHSVYAFRHDLLCFSMLSLCHIHRNSRTLTIVRRSSIVTPAHA